MRKASVIWNPKYAGRIAVYDYYVPVMQMVAIGLGIIPPQITTEHLPAIRAKLLEMKPLAALVGDVVTVQNALVTGSADIIAGGGEFAVAGLQGESPNMDWVLPDEGGIRWMQSLAIFETSARKEAANQFVQYVMSPDGQARLATSACYWAMPASSKASLDDAQKKTLRWDEQPSFLPKSYHYMSPEPEIDAAMLEVWTEFLNA
jgi:spermidine/putrescine transport system substrate-binding protein